MSAIPQATADKVLALCGRHCCVCRKFRPLLLQVHHIKEQNEGGGHDEDNLIATCVNCHAEIHTETKLTRRFTHRELKQHRDQVYEAVKAGRLVEVKDHDDKIDRLIEALTRVAAPRPSAVVVPAPSVSPVPVARASQGGLTPEAIEILLSTATTDYGHVIVGEGDAGFYVLTPKKQFHDRNPRKEAALRAAVSYLTRAGIIEGSPPRYTVSVYGYEVADALISTAAAQK
jgi:hypothetical protein